MMMKKEDDDNTIAIVRHVQSINQSNFRWRYNCQKRKRDNDYDNNTIEEYDDGDDENDDNDDDYDVDGAESDWLFD